jgi:hypothetical protein
MKIIPNPNSASIVPRRGDVFIAHCEQVNDRRPTYVTVVGAVVADADLDKVTFRVNHLHADLRSVRSEVPRKYLWAVTPDSVALFRLEGVERR